MFTIRVLVLSSVGHVVRYRWPLVLTVASVVSSVATYVVLLERVTVLVALAFMLL
jgi:hypothetical protein